MLKSPYVHARADECVGLFNEDRRSDENCPVCFCSPKAAFVRCIRGHRICHRCWAEMNSMGGSPVSRFGARMDMPCPVCRVDLTMNSGLECCHSGIMQNRDRISCERVGAITEQAFAQFATVASKHLKLPEPRVTVDVTLQIWDLATCPASLLFRNAPGADTLVWSDSAVYFLRRWATVTMDIFVLGARGNAADDKNAMRVALSWFGVWAVTLLNTIEFNVRCDITKAERLLRAPRATRLKVVHRAIQDHMADTFPDVKALKTCSVALVGGLPRSTVPLGEECVLGATNFQEIRIVRMVGDGLCPAFELCDVTFEAPHQFLPLYQTTIKMSTGDSCPNLFEQVHRLFSFYSSGIGVGEHEFWALHRQLVTAKVERQVDGRRIASFTLGDSEANHRLPRRLQFVLPDSTFGKPGQTIDNEGSACLDYGPVNGQWETMLQRTVSFKGTFGEFVAGLAAYLELCLLEFRGIEDRNQELLAQVAECHCEVYAAFGGRSEKGDGKIVANICKSASKEYRNMPSRQLLVNEVECSDVTLYVPMPLYRCA